MQIMLNFKGRFDTIKIFKRLFRNPCLLRETLFLIGRFAEYAFQLPLPHTAGRESFRKEDKLIEMFKKLTVYLPRICSKWSEGKDDDKCSHICWINENLFLIIKFMHSVLGGREKVFGYSRMLGKGVRSKHIYLVSLKSHHVVNYLPSPVFIIYRSWLFWSHLLTCQ